MNLFLWAGLALMALTIAVAVGAFLGRNELRKALGLTWRAVYDAEHRKGGIPTVRRLGAFTYVDGLNVNVSVHTVIQPAPEGEFGVAWDSDAPFVIRAGDVIHHIYSGDVRVLRDGAPLH